MRHIRYALRQLAKSPGFSAAALLTLGLGIGACLAIFSVVSSVLLRPLPYFESDRLVVVSETKLPEFPEFSVAPGQYSEWKKQSSSFESLAALRQGSYNLTGSGEPVRISAGRVSANVFSTLRVHPALGRDFSPEEETEGRDNVAILSHGLWMRRFGGRADVLSHRINLDGRTFSIIGVMPKSFQLVGPLDIYTPAAYTAAERQDHGGHVIELVFGRLGPGVTVDQANSELAVIAIRLARLFPATNDGWGVKVRSMLEAMVGDARDVLFALLGSVGFLLLIACANVANLLLARATGRAKEIAVRAALGATRGRILRQLLTESLVLAVMGAALGVLFGYIGLSALVAFLPEGTPRAQEIGIDAPALAFTSALALVTGIGFGLAPAFQATRISINETLKESGRAATGGGRRHRMRGALVVAEVAIAFILLVGAGLFIRSFARLQGVHPGFQPEGATAVTLSLAANKYASDEQRAIFARQAVENLAALPAVVSVGASHVLPLSGKGTIYAFQVAGRVVPTNEPVANHYAVTPDYFRAMGIPMLRGRAFDSRDVATSSPVAIINESLAKRLFPGEEPIGKRISISNGPEAWREIVSVVGDVKHEGLAQRAPLQIYEPFAQRPSDSLSIVVRTKMDAIQLAGALRSTIYALDKDQPIATIRPLTEYLSDSVAGERFAMFLFVVFSCVALLLAAIGIYGVVSYAVTQRTGEIGIRMALGSQPSAVLRLVFLQGGRLVAIGLVVGVVGALLLTRLLASILFGVSADDPLTFVAIAAILALIAAIACFIPAHRATKVDPLIALRANLQ